MNRALLIGLDGATYTILDPLMENGTMPFLKEFVRGGTRLKLLSTANPLTPPAWISLVTGRTPGNHGVFDFIWAEKRKKDHYFTLYNFRDIQCETIWSMISRSKGRICSLNFPMMSPPPAVSGVIIPGLVSWKHLRRNMYPAELYEQLKQIPGFNAKELAWDFDMEKKAERGISQEEYEHWVEFHIRREKLWFEIACYLMKRDTYDLMAVLFDGPDKIMHMGYRFLDPAIFPAAPTPWEREMRDMCLAYFSALDGFIAELVNIAGSDARIFMASDHGFGPSWQVFRVNSWLGSKGYLVWKDIDSLDEKSREQAQKVIDKHFVLLDWEKTSAYARTVTSNGIYINVAEDSSPGGIPQGEYKAFRDRLINELYEVQDPETGERVIQQILTKEEAYPGENNAQAPDLTLVMRDHGFISILNKTPVLYHRPYVEGTHYPEGIFLAKGPGIKKGFTEGRMSVEDVASCILYSLGMDVPGNFDGKMPMDIFEPSFLNDHPCLTGAPTVPVGFSEEKVDMQENEKKEIFEQLKALGYME